MLRKTQLILTFCLVVQLLSAQEVIPLYQDKKGNNSCKPISSIKVDPTREKGPAELVKGKL